MLISGKDDYSVPFSTLIMIIGCPKSSLSLNSNNFMLHEMYGKSSYAYYAHTLQIMSFARNAQNPVGAKNFYGVLDDIVVLCSRPASVFFTSLKLKLLFKAFFILFFAGGHCKNSTLKCAKINALKMSMLVERPADDGKFIYCPLFFSRVPG